MSRYDDVWNGRDRIMPAQPVVPTLLIPEAGATASRFHDYARKQLTALSAAPGRIYLNETKIRLCDQMHFQLAFVRNDQERLALLGLFCDAISELRLLESEIDPPPFVREIRVEVPVSKPKKPAKPGGLWFTQVED